MSQKAMDIENDMRRHRIEALSHYALDALRQTVQLRGMTPETPIEDVRADFTDASVQVISSM